MKCPKCGAENRFNSVNCDTCGTSLLDGPSDEPFDLNGFTPVQDAPAAQAASDSDAEKNNGTQQPADNTPSDAWEKVRSYAASVGKWLWNILKKLAAIVGRGLKAFSDWLVEKARFIKRKFDDGNGIEENDEKFRKFVLAAALLVLAVILVVLFICCGSCGSCTCAGSTGKSICGTWVEAECAADGYDSTDFILELTADGQLIDRGLPVGSYSFTDNSLTFTLNGMEYSSEVAPDADEMIISLNGYSTVTVKLIKLSDNTGLSSAELAELYEK